MSPTQLLAAARRRAWQMRAARTDAMRQALARRICFDLVAAMRGPPTNTPAREGERRGVPLRGQPDAEVVAGATTARISIEQA